MSDGVVLLRRAVSLAALGALAVVGGCSSETEPATDRTPEGAIISVEVGPVTVHRGDSVHVEVTLRNPTNTAMVVNFSSQCRFHLRLTDASWHNVLGNGFSCPPPGAPVTIPGLGAIYQDYAFTDSFFLGNERVTLAAGQYHVQGGAGPFAGSSRIVLSAPVTLMLRDP